MVKAKKLRLDDIAAVMNRGANILVVNPFDENHKESIIKGLESCKLDIQIKIDGNNIVVNLGDMPSDVKTECLNSLKKMSTKAIDQIKDIRHSIVNEMKKVEKILSKDDARKLEKTILADVIEK